jgi:hypothetical protein
MAGRKPSIATQRDRFLKAHPKASYELMEMLFGKALNGSSEDAKYLVDQFEGKARQQVSLDVKAVEVTLTADEYARITLAKAQEEELLQGGQPLQNQLQDVLAIEEAEE